MTIPQRTVCVSRVPAKTFNSSMPFLDKKISLEQSHNVPTISGVPVCLIEEFIIYRVHQPNIPTSTINKIKRNPTRESSRSVSWLMKRICSTKSITTKSWRRWVSQRWWSRRTKEESRRRKEARWRSLCMRPMISVNSLSSKEVAPPPTRTTVETRRNQIIRFSLISIHRRRIRILWADLRALLHTSWTLHWSNLMQAISVR